MLKKIIFTLVVLFTVAGSFCYGMEKYAGPVEESIESAGRAGQIVFLVITDPGIAGTEQALKIANQAHKKFTRSQVLQLNRSDAVNKELVDKYRVAGAPLPMILVIATNGKVSGGFMLDQANADLLVESVPSLVRAEIVNVVSEHKAAFLVVGRKNMKGRKEAMQNCQQASIEMQNNASVFFLDLSDPVEKRFLVEMKVDPAIASPQIFVINSKGQITGNFNEITDAATLVASANIVIDAKACCAGGSGAGCISKE